MKGFVSLLLVLSLMAGLFVPVDISVFAEEEPATGSNIHCFVYKALDDNGNVMTFKNSGKTYERTELIFQKGDTPPYPDREYVMHATDFDNGEKTNAALGIGGKEAYVLHVTLRGEIVREIMRELLLSLGQDAAAADEADLTDVSVDAVMYVWKDTYQIAGIRMDCTSLGNVMIREIAGDNGIEVETKKFVISYTADEYDTVDDLQIPQEVIDSSQSGTASILENLLP